MKKWLILIPLVVFATPDTATIQLQQVQRTGGGLGLGITLSVGGTTSLFLFDTGSTGLYVASGQIGNATQVMPIVPFAQNYESGISFQGTDYQGTISFPGSGISAENALFGSITCAADTSPTCPGPCTPSSSCFPTSDTPGLYGTFGASLIPGVSTQGNLYSIIAQLPGNLSSGFIVQTGGIAGTPMLTIGLTEENRQGFISAQLPMDGTYPNGNPGWGDTSLDTITNLSFGGLAQTFIGPVVFDTGASDTTIRPSQATPPVTIDTQFLDITMTKLAAGVVVNNVVNNAINWPNIAGTTTSQNIVKVSESPAVSGTYMNSGIDVYFTYDVMFDMANGLLGFRPIEQQIVSGMPNNTVISTALGDLNGIPTSLVQSGPGNVILTGTNTYSNGTILTGGSLTISSDANLGNSIGGVIFNGGALNVTANYATQRSISVFSNGGIFNTNALSSTFSGPLTGTGTLEIIGFGSLIYSGTAGTLFSGAINIAAGTFAASGSLQSATINVGNVGALMGPGPVNNVSSIGVVNPGQGTLNVTGNYTQGPSGTLVIELGSLSNYGQLIVGQTAQLNGTLQAFRSQGYLPNPGDTFSILTGGSVVGQFSSISLLWPTLEVVPIYNPDPSIVMLINRNYANPQLGYLNRNQIAFGNMLNAEISNPAVFPLLNLLNGVSSPAVLLDAYDVLIPSQYLSQIRTSFYRTTLTLENVEDRLHDLHGCRCFDTCVDFEVRGIFQDRRATTLENAFFAQGVQIDAEIEHAFTDQIFIGSYGDYTFLHTAFSSHGGTIDNSSGALFGYGCYQTCNWYTDLILGGMYNWYHNERYLDILGMDLTAKSSNHAGEIAGLFKIGYVLSPSAEEIPPLKEGWLQKKLGPGSKIGPCCQKSQASVEDSKGRPGCCLKKWSLDPNLFLQAAHSFSSSFIEHGASLFDMRGKIKGANSLQTGLGLNYRRYFYLIREKPSTLEFYTNWLYECLHNRYSMVSRLVDANATFTTVSSTVQKNYGFAGANLNLSVTCRLDCRITYAALFTSRNWLQSGSAGISAEF